MTPRGWRQNFWTACCLLNREMLLCSVLKTSLPAPPALQVRAAWTSSAPRQPVPVTTRVPSERARHPSRLRRARRSPRLRPTANRSLTSTTWRPQGAPPRRTATVPRRCSSRCLPRRRRRPRCSHTRPRSSWPTRAMPYFGCLSRRRRCHRSRIFLHSCLCSLLHSPRPQRLRFWSHLTPEEGEPVPRLNSPPFSLCRCLRHSQDPLPPPRALQKLPPAPATDSVPMPERSLAETTATSPWAFSRKTQSVSWKSTEPGSRSYWSSEWTTGFRRALARRGTWSPHWASARWWSTTHRPNIRCRSPRSSSSRWRNSDSAP